MLKFLVLQNMMKFINIVLQNMLEFLNQILQNMMKFLNLILQSRKKLLNLILQNNKITEYSVKLLTPLSLSGTKRPFGLVLSTIE